MDMASGAGSQRKDQVLCELCRLCDCAPKRYGEQVCETKMEHCGLYGQALNIRVRTEVWNTMHEKIGSRLSSPGGEAPIPAGAFSSASCFQESGAFRHHLI